MSDTVGYRAGTTDASGEVTSDPLPALEADLRARTTVVLDTCVLIADPDALLSFGESDVVLPLTVIEELDSHKTRPDDVGRNARASIRAIEELRVNNPGQLSTGMPLPTGGTLRIEPNGLRLAELASFHLSPGVADNRILAAALGLAAEGRRVQVVSLDGAVRVKAEVLGLDAVDYRRTARGAYPTTRSGWRVLDVAPATIDALYADRRLPLSELSVPDLVRNEFVVLRAEKQSALARVGSDAVHRLPRNHEAWGLTPKSKEQTFALDLLLDPAVTCLALSGHAGTGKTILAIAAGLQQTFERDAVYSRMTILRPVIGVGKQELGFLPGTVEDKLGPWFEAVVDTMVALSGTGQTHRDCKAQLAAWVEEGRLTLEAVTYLRGRSLQSTYVLVDEAQNLEPSTVKTIVSRLGHGSKAVLVGDVSQVDSPWTSEHTNGLSVLADAFAGEELFGQVVLSKGERSELADLAAQRL